MEIEGNESKLTLPLDASATTSTSTSKRPSAAVSLSIHLSACESLHIQPTHSSLHPSPHLKPPPNPPLPYKLPDLPIITTPHAKSHLASASKDPSETFTAVHDLDFFDDCLVDIVGSSAAIKVTGMPGKHVPPGPGGVAGKLNDLLGAVGFVSFCPVLSCSSACLLSLSISFSLLFPPLLPRQ